MKLTPEQYALREQARTAKKNKLVTTILQLKAEGLRHCDIASQLNISTAYVHKLSSQINKAK